MKYRATSTRMADGHGTNFFSMDVNRALDWADAEFAAGYDVDVFEARETPVCPARVHPKACKCGHLRAPNAKRCSKCGVSMEAL